MTLRRLQKTGDAFQCPTCGGNLKFSDGGAVAIVNGHLDMENYKPRYICNTCNVFFREVMSTGYYDVFPLEPVQESAAQAEDKKPATAPAGPVALQKDASGKRHCPKCGHEFREVEGGSVRIVNGKVDMENTKPKFECDTCGVFYREVLTSDFYLPYLQTEEDVTAPAEEKKAAAPKKKLVATGDLPPMMLKRDANDQCKCPRCGEMMRYIEGDAVRLVDGKPYMDDVLDHFACDSCASVFRRIVNTDYFQWSDK